MAKVLKTVVKVVVAAALITVGVLTGNSALIIQGVFFAISALVDVVGLFKSPKANNTVGDRLNKQVAPTAPRKIAFGRTAAGTDIRFFEKYGSKQDAYVEIIAVASHKIQGFRSLTFEDELSWNGSSIVGKYASGITGIVARTEGAANNAFSAGSGAYWTTSCRMTGCAYLAVSYKLDDKIWPNGIPSRITIEVDGCPVYDPRRDSTNGGSGSHRLYDQNTWEFTSSGTSIGRNPALALLSYLVGWRINGRLAWGMGVPPERINLANFINYANICEELVSLQAGGTTQRYTCDLLTDTSQTHEAIIDTIAACMGSCRLVDVDGLYQFVGGYDDTFGPKTSFSADDLVGPYEWRPSPPTRERFNIVRGRFADPTKLYQLNDWPAVEVTALADGIPRTKTIDLPAITRPETAQRIGKQFLLRDQYPGLFTGVFGPRGFLVQVGSLVTLSLPQEGWNNKLFRVVSQTENHDLVFQMTLQEESSQIYAWDREEKPLPPNITPPGYDHGLTLNPQGLSAISRIVRGSNGLGICFIDISWTPETSGRVSGIEIQTKEASGSIWSTATEGLFSAASGSFTTRAAAPGIEINIRARYRMSTGVYGDWSTILLTSKGTSISVTDSFINESWNYSTLSDAPWAFSANGVAPSLVYSASAGKTVLSVGGDSGNQGSQGEFKYSIPFDANALYEISWTIKTITPGDGVAYVGVVARDSSGANIQSYGGTYHYVSLAGASLTAGVRAYKGYFRGLATVGPGVGTPSIDPANPSPLAMGTVWIAPIFILNYLNKTGRHEIEAVSLRKIEDVQAASFELIPLGAVSVAGKTIRKTGSTNAWDAGARSKALHPNGAYVSFQFRITPTDDFAGLSASTTSNPIGDSVNYGWFRWSVDNNLYIYELGVQRGNFGSYSAGMTLSVVYDGVNARYYKDGALVYTSDSAIGLSLGLRVSLYQNGSSVTILDFGSLQGRMQDSRGNPYSIANIASYQNAPALSSSTSGSSSTVTISAFSRAFDFGTVNYNGGSVSGLAPGVLYYIYYDDPNFSGSVSYVASTNIQAAGGSPNRTLLGSIKTPATTGTSPPPPPPREDNCVAVDMFLRANLLAGDAKVNELLYVMADDLSYLGLQKVVANKVAQEECVEISTKSASVIVSVSAPVVTRTGLTLRAPEVLGHEVAVLIDGEFGFEAIVSVKPAGLKAVAKINVAGMSYAAGARPDRMIFTHNIYYKP